MTAAVVAGVGRKNSKQGVKMKQKKYEIEYENVQRPTMSCRHGVVRWCRGIIVCVCGLAWCCDSKNRIQRFAAKKNAIRGGGGGGEIVCVCVYV